MTGTTISHYRIVAELGKGGMGVVYKAEDTKLDRTVALKLLAPHMLASDADRSRFYREARAAAALHHPNIATVFEIDETGDGRPFIAMEYIEGAQLDEGLAERPLQIDRAVAVARQIAEALKEAHEQGIVHRDIKSANVMLTKEGAAKVLDFGLAKTDASTKLTQMGSTVGTIAYMSPEQARGEQVDHRTDLWSLGVVLYEMLTGQLPFPGSYEQAVVYGILNAEPEPVTALRTGVPMELERIVTKLLTKEAEYRYQSAAGLLADLKSLDMSGTDVSRRSIAAVPAPSRRRIPWLAIATLAVGLAIGAGAMLLRPAPEIPAPTVQRFDLLVPEMGDITDMSLSPDGSKLALVAQAEDQVLIVDLTTGSRREIEFSSALSVDFSPDSRRMLISGLYGVARANADGSDRISVRDEPGIQFGVWQDDATYAISTFADYFVLYPEIGQTDTVRAPFEGSIMAGSPLDDRRIVVGRMGEQLQGYIFDRRTREWSQLGEAGFNVLPTGHAVFISQEGAVSVMPIDMTSVEGLGPRVPLSDLEGAMWTASDTGTLVYKPAGDDDDAVFELGVRSPDGQVRQIVAQMGNLFDLSPAGDRIVAHLGEDPDDRNLTVVDVATGLPLRVGDGTETQNDIDWSTDERILFYSEGLRKIMATPSDGTATSEPLTEALFASSDFDVHPAGDRVAWAELGSGDGFNLGIRELDMRTDSTRWLVEPLGIHVNPAYSPDGSMLAIRVMNDLETGPIRILNLEDGRSYTLPMPDDADEHRWSASGDAIEYEINDSLMAIPVDTRSGFQVTGGAELIAYLPGMSRWTRTANGDIYYSRRIETEDQPEEEAGEPIALQVVVNWFEEIKRIAPHPDDR